jgi:diguanylate cyclase (GGDEF)-like protein
VPYVLFGVAAWVRPDPPVRDRSPGLQALVVPAGFALVAVVMTVYCGIADASVLAVSCAAVALTGVIVRFVLTFRSYLRVLGATAHEAATDALTGLGNRRALALDLEAAFAGGESAVLLLFDLNGFKGYNDAFGHPAGDEVLQRIAEIMRGSTRKGDCCARYGGEEFVIVLPNTAIADALDTAEHIRARVAAKKFNGRKITLSIGVASFPEDADDAETIIAVADEALYQAKREGRDRTVRARRLKKTG